MDYLVDLLNIHNNAGPEKFDRQNFRFKCG